MDYNPNHAGLEGLLDLDGEILVVTEAGHWVKIEARVVAESELRRFSRNFIPLYAIVALGCNAMSPTT